MRRGGTILIIGLIASASACTKEATPPPPSPTPTPTATDARASFIALYETACSAIASAGAGIEQPAQDGGTSPPSPPAEALDAWATWARALEQVHGSLVSAIQALPAPPKKADAAANLVALRDAATEAIGAIASRAEAGDRDGFSEAFSDWVAAGHDAGVAEERFGIRCDA